MRRFLSLFACALILWTIVAQLNHSVSGTGIYLFVGALFVTFPALMQPFRGGMINAIAIGFVCDAGAPVAFGTHALLFGLTHVMIFRLRERLPRSDTVTRVIVAVLANLGLFLAFSFTQVPRSPVAGHLWPRLFMDLFCSQALIALIAPWHFALQARALVLAGEERENFA